MNALDRNHKERAEGAHEELMKEATHFLSHQGSIADLWMHDKLIDGRCEELKYSRWDKSTRMERGYELLESKFGSQGNRGQILNVGEWRVVFKEKMRMFSNKHYYVRKQNIMEDMEEAMKEVQEIWHNRLGMVGGVVNRQMEEIHLVGLTPEGLCDSLLVAEAVISKEATPRLLDLEEPDTRSKLRRVEYGLDTFDTANLDLSINMGKGSVIRSSIGGKRMKEICKENNTGFIRIKDGVMERLIPKTDRPDVIHDEDIDHFYLNGVGKVVKETVIIKNKVIFWNCNGWSYR